MTMPEKKQEPAGNKGRKILSISLRPAEYVALLVAARRDGCQVSAFTRRVTLAYVSGCGHAPEVLLHQLRSLSVDIRRIGNNVNQLAHLANQKKIALSFGKPVDYSAELKTALEQLRLLEKQLRQCIQGRNA